MILLLGDSPSIDDAVDWIERTIERVRAKEAEAAIIMTKRTKKALFDFSIFIVLPRLNAISTWWPGYLRRKSLVHYYDCTNEKYEKERS